MLTATGRTPTALTAIPACIACGYDLRGLKVEDVCPECGRPIWSTISPGAGWGVGETRLTLGTASIALVFLLGPLALLCAVPAIVIGRRARVRLVAGELPAAATASIRIGVRCAWVGLVLSSALVVCYLVLLSKIL